MANNNDTQTIFFFFFVIALHPVCLSTITTELQLSYHRIGGLPGGLFDIEIPSLAIFGILMLSILYMISPLSFSDAAPSHHI